MKTKRLIAMLLAVMMVLSLIPVAAFAEPAHTHTLVYTAELEHEVKLEPTSDEWFDCNSDGVITKFNPGECDGAPTDIVIPATVDGTPVTGLGEYAFGGCESLKSVVIPEGVTAIGNDAFTFCSSLKSVVIPESVTTIGIDAFSFCGALESVTIPSGVTDIGAGAFQYCAAFTSIVIPAGVTDIGGSAFIYCESLEFVTFLGQPAAIGGEDQNAFEGVGDCVPCTLNLPATWTGDPAVGANASWQGGTFAVVKAVPEVSALEEAQTAALAELGKLNPVSDAAKAVIADAIKAIEAAASPEEVAEIVAKAKEDVAAQQEAEKPTEKSWVDILLEMLDQYLPTVGKFTRSVINATVKAIKDTEALVNYLEKLFDIIF